MSVMQQRKQRSALGAKKPLSETEKPFSPVGFGIWKGRKETVFSAKSASSADRNKQEEWGMSYSAKLEEMIDAVVKRWQNVEKKKMFGGVGYLLKGNMAFGIHKDFLIVRLDKEQGEQSLKNANVQPFDITGKPMAGWIMVTDAGWKSAAGLAKWMGIGKQFALSLPEKKEKARKKKTLREYNIKS